MRAVHEIEHAVTVGRKAGGDGGPDHRRDGRLDGLHRRGHPSRRQRPDVGDAAVVRQLVQQLPVGAVEGEDDDARRRAARVAPQLGVFDAEKSITIDFDARDLESGDFQPALAR